MGRCIYYFALFIKKDTDYWKISRLMQFKHVKQYAYTNNKIQDTPVQTH